MKSNLSELRKMVGIASVINGAGMLIFYGFILQIFKTEAYDRIRIAFAVYEFLHYLIASMVLIYFVKAVLDQDGRAPSQARFDEKQEGYYKRITIKNSSESEPVKWVIALIIVADFMVYVLAWGKMLNPAHMETILLVLGSISVVYGVLFFQRVHFEDEQQNRFKICYAGVSFISGLLLCTIKFVPFAIIFGCAGEVLMGHFLFSLWKETPEENPEGKFA